MTVSFKHAFTSAKVDGTDSTLIQPSNWNAEHVLTLAAGKVLGRDASGSGAAQELAIAVDATQQSMIPPSGNTASRPATAVAGMMRYNTTTAKFEGYNGAWGTLGGGALISDTAPSSPVAGDLWWKSSDGQMYIYYDDGTSTQWVIANYFTGLGTFLPLTGGVLSGTLGVGRTPSAGYSLQTAGTIGVNDGTVETFWAAVGAGSAATLGTVSNHALVLYTNNTERARIDNAGNVGIGTTSPSYPLDVRTTTSVARVGPSVGGAVIMSTVATQGIFGAGFDFNGANFIARATNVAFVAADNGNMDLYQGIGVTSGNSFTPTKRATLDVSGNFLIVSSGGLGYGTGSGGAVTQITSKATGVTLNKLSGQVTMSNAALAANTTVSFVVSNSAYTTSIDTAVAVITGGVANGGNYLCWTSNGGSGSFQVNVRNISAGSLSEAVAINIFVIRGAVT